MNPTLNLLEGSRRSVNPLAFREAGVSHSLAQILDRAIFAATGAEGPLQRAFAGSADFGSALGRLSATERAALERRLGGAGLAELASLGREDDPELFLEGLLAFARRQEAAGRLEAAAGLYAEIVGANLRPHSRREDEASGGFAPGQGRGGRTQSSLLQVRAQEHLDALVGRGAAGPRAEFLLRRLAHEATEPSTLVAMTAAGALYRVTRLATLGRLAASPHANLFTRGLGARALSGLAGFALEAPAFTLGGRLASEALGRNPDWSGAALSRDIASSYLVLGGLRLAGWASGAAYRGLANPGGAIRERPLQLLFQQGGMLAGILLGHSLETRLGLRPQVAGATTLIDSLALLVQFNVAGRLTHHAFGPRVAAWERGLDAQTEALARENLGILRPRRGGFPFGPLPALAAAGPAVPELGRRPVEDLLRGLQVHMSKMDEGGMGGRGPENSAAGRGGTAPGVDPNRLDRDISTFLLTAGDNFEAGLRTFIDNQPIATAVARLERNNNDFGRIFMANRKFTELFGYSEAEAGQHNITFFFNKLSLPFIASRIWGIFRGGIFAPSNMKFRHRDGNWVDIVGSGVIKDVAGHSIAFGFYEPRNEAGRGERSQKQLLDALSSSNREAPLRSNEGVFEMESVSELSAQLTRSGSPLLQRALEQDLRVRITNMPWVHAPESYADPLLRYFNLQARKLEFPLGRRVVVEFPATDSRPRASITMVKFSEGFRALGLAEAEANAPAAEPPAGARRTTAPVAAVSEPAAEGPPPPDARSAAALERLQSQLGAALSRERERVAREDVTLTLSGPFDAAFLSQNLESLTGELQALTQNRIPIPLGRLVTLEIPTERGTVRLVYKKVLLNFERVE